MKKIGSFLLVLLLLGSVLAVGSPMAIAETPLMSKVQSALADFSSEYRVGQSILWDARRGDESYCTGDGQANIVSFRDHRYVAIWWTVPGFKQLMLFVDLDQEKVVTDLNYLIQLAQGYLNAFSIGGLMRDDGRTVSSEHFFKDSAQNYGENAQELVELAEQAKLFQVAGLSLGTVTWLYKLSMGDVDPGMIGDGAALIWGSVLLAQPADDPNIEAILGTRNDLRAMAKGMNYVDMVVGNDAKAICNAADLYSQHHRALQGAFKSSPNKWAKVLSSPDSSLSHAQRQIKGAVLDIVEKLIDPSAGFEFVADSASDQRVALTFDANSQARAAELLERIAGTNPGEPAETISVCKELAAAYDWVSWAWDQLSQKVDDRFKDLNVPLILSNALGWLKNALNLPDWMIGGWTGDDLKAWKELSGKYQEMADLMRSIEEFSLSDAKNIISDLAEYLDLGRPEVAISSSTVLLMDVSGSMGNSWQGGVKIESAQKAALDLTRMVAAENGSFHTSHQLGLATFSTTAQLVQGLAMNSSTIEQAIASISPQQNTNMGGGLEVALLELKNAKPKDKLIILLSDGKTNEGPDKIEILSRIVSQAVAQQVKVYTVGFGNRGEEIDEDLLQQIAEKTGGSYFYAGSGFDLSKAYVLLRHQSMGEVLLQKEGAIRQGEILDLGDVSVGKGKDVPATIHYGGSRIDLIFTDPSGKKLTAQSSEISYVPGPPDYYLIQNAMPGNWQVSIVGSEVPEATLSFQVVVSQRQASAMPGEGGWSWPLVILIMVLVAGGVAGLVIFTIYRTKIGGGFGWELVWQDSEGKSHCRPILGSMAVGRSSQSDLSFPWDMTVSQKHLKLTRGRNGVVLEDLESTNGTWVEGKRVARLLLDADTWVRIGHQSMLVRHGRRKA